MSKIFFITGTGTDVGKSFYLQKLIKYYKKNNIKFNAIKPVISGFDINDHENDSSLILKSLNLNINIENLNKISPWRFKEPVSPNIACKLENQEINFDDIVEFCQNSIKYAKNNNQNLLIEGAGGIMTPINDQFTYLDLMKSLKIPVILVTLSYLGTISHTLSAIKCLEDEDIEINRIILNHYNRKFDNEGNFINLKQFSTINIEEIF